MSPPWSRLEGPARLLVNCVVILLIAGGLCGLQLFTLNFTSNNGALTSLLMVTGAVELAAMLASALVGLFALLAWIWKLITRP